MSDKSKSADETATLSPAIQALFPDGVVAAERHAPGDVELLFPEERIHVQRAVDKRVREFAAGRACARRVLAELGISDFTLLPGQDRQPLWPLSMVGSISHTSGYCVAVAAPKELIAAIGIDSERTAQVGRDLWETIACPMESEWCMSLPDAERPAAMTLLFSAKEAFYKCQYSLTGNWLDFHDIRIEPSSWGSENPDFAVHFNRALEIEPHLSGLPRGRYRIHEGLVTVGIALPARVQGQ